MSTIPEGWTDDMTIPLPPGRTVEDFAVFVIKCALAGVPDKQIQQRLVESFQVSTGDAALVRDRVFGGIARAATGNGTNCPDPTKDPFAFTSFERAIREPAIVATIYPQFAQSRRRSWWHFWRR